MTLVVTDLSIHFGGVIAVADMNLEVKPREIVGLIGPNGAGKTTFINCIAGVNQPDTGTATWNGREIPRSYAGRVAADRRGADVSERRLAARSDGARRREAWRRGACAQCPRFHWATPQI